LTAPSTPAKKPFAIVIPPPNVTGELHIGHALNNTLQDIVIRYKRMDGYEACWFPGTDHASIAVHVLIERGLAKRQLDDLLRQIGYPVPSDKRPLTRYDLGREYFIKAGLGLEEPLRLADSREQLRALGCSAATGGERASRSMRCARAPSLRSSCGCMKRALSIEGIV
jgi:valyl-tRNA synthetase